MIIKHRYNEALYTGLILSILGIGCIFVPALAYFFLLGTALMIIGILWKANVEEAQFEAQEEVKERAHQDALKD